MITITLSCYLVYHGKVIILYGIMTPCYIFSIQNFNPLSDIWTVCNRFSFLGWKACWAADSMVLLWTTHSRIFLVYKPFHLDIPGTVSSHRFFAMRQCHEPYEFGFNLPKMFVGTIGQRCQWHTLGGVVWWKNKQQNNLSRRKIFSNLSIKISGVRNPLGQCNTFIMLKYLCSWHKTIHAEQVPLFH
jgi:hypothetical protein